MKSVLPVTALACGLILSSQSLLAQDHGHLNVGALSIAQGTPLIFDNAADFASTAGYVKTLTITNAGRYAGYFQGNITLTVLPATADYGGPDAHAPALGSHIMASIVSVEGPAGGEFAFWENLANAPTIAIPSGGTSTNSFAISQTDGSAGVDPFGHFHGRRFTATKPGIYKIGFKAFDNSVNGAGGGAIHTPSDVLHVTFQAGVNISSILHTNGTARITYGSVANRSCIVECSTNLMQTNWTVIATQPGNDYFQTATNPAAGDQRFYRVRTVLP